MDLTVHQRRIVQTTLPHVEVIASPGSGKTTTLMQRLAHLVRCGVSFSEILVLSFFNGLIDEAGRVRECQLLPNASYCHNSGGTFRNQLLPVFFIGCL